MYTSKWLTGHSGVVVSASTPNFFERNQMGLIVESKKENVSGEARSKSFTIYDEIGGWVEFDWEEWDDLVEVIKLLEPHKP